MSKEAPHIPLRNRLPNPPPIFIGRAEELEQATAAIRRGPITLLWGAAGIGKSALALRTLHRSFRKRVPETVVVRTRPGDRGHDVWVGAVRALARAAGQTSINWPSISNDTDALIATALDLAELDERWVVLEDLHHLPPEEVAALLTDLATYARGSRWIAITREAPALMEIAEQLIELRGLQADELSALADQWSPEVKEDKRRRSVELAEGSPWRLRRALAGELDDSESDGLSEPMRAAVQTLSLIDRPVPMDLVNRLPGGPDDATRLELVRRGWFVRDETGISVAQAYQHSMRDELDEAKRAELEIGIAEVLCDSGETELELEAVRLLARNDRADEILTFLERRGEALLLDGWAPELCRQLEGLRAETLAGWRLYAAVEFGDPGAMEGLQRPRGQSADDALRWTRALYSQSDFEAAASAAADARTLYEEDNPDVGFECALLQARALANLDRHEAALEVLEPLEGRDLDQTARRDTGLALCLAAADRAREAMDAVARVRPRLGELGQRAALEAGYWIAGTAYRLGNLVEAETILDEMIERAGERALFLEHGRMLSLLRALITTERGRLDEARDLFDRLEPLCAPGSPIELYVRNARARFRLAIGELGELDSEIEELTSRAEPLPPDHQIRQSINALRLQWSHLNADRADVEPVEGDTFFTQRTAWLTHERALRHGEATSVGGPTDDGVELAVLSLGVRGLDGMMSGDPDAAVACARAVARAREAGYGVLLAEALVRQGDVLLGLGKRAEVGRVAEDLAEQADRIGSPRFRAAATWLRAVAGEAIRPHTLEELAVGGADPVTLRRARAQLGAAVTLDAVDERVIGERRARPVLGERREWRPGWGIDAVRQQAWLPDGEVLTFGSGSVQWKLLHDLAEHGGSASKEDLAIRVWGESEYHPLKHDNRMRLAVRKLRRVLEIDAGNPIRLVTTPEGYSLGGEPRYLPG